MSEPSPERRIFSLDQARELLPRVKALTADAVHNVEALTAELEADGADVVSGGANGANGAHEVGEEDVPQSRLNKELEQVVAQWASRITELGLEAKGMWLVDFDAGSGYYCWRYPEDSVLHFHGYEDGFEGRMKIV